MKPRPQPTVFVDESALVVGTRTLASLAVNVLTAGVTAPHRTLVSVFTPRQQRLP